MDSQNFRLQEIEAQIKRFKERLVKLEKKSRNLGTIKAIIFLSWIIIFLIFFFYWTTLAVIIIGILFLLFFGILTKYHNEIDNGIKKQKIWIDIKSTNLARINIDWEKLPYKKTIKQNKSHPFELDLNISGEFSIHRLIDSSVTIEGSQKLLDWLTTKEPSLDDIISRQNIIKELIPLRRFREKLQLCSSLITKKVMYGEILLE